MAFSIEWLVASAVGVVVWLVRLEGRVNTYEREVTRQFDVFVQSREEMRDDIKYIRSRIDAMVAHVALTSRNTAVKDE